MRGVRCDVTRKTGDSHVDRLYLYIKAHHSQKLDTTEDARLVELVVNVEMFVEVFPAQHVEQSRVNELCLKRSTVLC